MFIAILEYDVFHCLLSCYLLSWSPALSPHDSSLYIPVPRASYSLWHTYWLQCGPIDPHYNWHTSQESKYNGREFSLLRMRTESYLGSSVLLPRGQWILIYILLSSLPSLILSVIDFTRLFSLQLSHISHTSWSSISVGLSAFWQGVRHLSHR